MAAPPETRYASAGALHGRRARRAERLRPRLPGRLAHGEVERRDDDIGGLAVHIAARIVALASPEEILVSAAVPPLVVGAGLRFRDAGTHTLKGVPEP